MALAEQYTPDPNLESRYYEEFMRLSERVDRMAAQLDAVLANGPQGALQVSGLLIAYTPIAMGNDGSTITSYLALGGYQLIGKRAFVSGSVAVTTAGAAAGQYLRISMPFPAVGSYASVGAGHDLNINGLASIGSLFPGTDQVVFRLYDNNGPIVSGLGFYFSISYPVA